MNTREEQELKRGVEIAVSQIIEQFDRGSSVEQLSEDWGFPCIVIAGILLTRSTHVGRA